MKKALWIIGLMVVFLVSGLAVIGWLSVEEEEIPLSEARATFRTRLVSTADPWPEEPAPAPPGGMSLVRYSSPAGHLAAYLTDDPGDGKRHPAVLWAKGGFGGIGEFLWRPGPAGNDQSVRTFADAGLVVMAPSWRGENDNPGRFELFYGEVDDYLAARDYLAKLPYVDPRRIYLAGHSTGGTIVLLAATATNKFRAAFSFGGRSDMGMLHAYNPEGYGNTPYDTGNGREHELRSAGRFVRFIEAPTFYFEGGEAPDVELMGARAALLGVPFEVFIIANGDHFDILRPVQAMLVERILSDDLSSRFSLSEEEVVLATRHLGG